MAKILCRDFPARFRSPSATLSVSPAESMRVSNGTPPIAAWIRSASGRCVRRERDAHVGAVLGPRAEDERPPWLLVFRLPRPCRRCHEVGDPARFLPLELPQNLSSRAELDSHARAGHRDEEECVRRAGDITPAVAQIGTRDQQCPPFLHRNQVGALVHRDALDLRDGRSFDTANPCSRVVRVAAEECVHRVLFRTGSTESVKRRLLKPGRMTHQRG